MFDGVGKGTFQVLLPLPGGGSGETVYQVDGYVLEAGGQGMLEGAVVLAGIVAPSKQAQLLVAERLGTEAEAVDARLAELFEIIPVRIVGVALQGDLRIVGYKKKVVYAPDDSSN